MLIYAIRNTVNGKVYIGQTVRSLEQRWAQHVLLSRVRNMPVCRAIRKHGADKFTRIVLFYAKDKAELDAAERTYILAFHSNEPERGYNLTLGGEGTVGWKPSEQVRKKWSQQRRGNKNSLGHRHSAATRRQISEKKRGCKGTWTGRKHSAESLRKMVEALRKRRKYPPCPRYGTHIFTNDRCPCGFARVGQSMFDFREAA